MSKLKRENGHLPDCGAVRGGMLPVCDKDCDAVTDAEYWRSAAVTFERTAGGRFTALLTSPDGKSELWRSPHEQASAADALAYATRIRQLRAWPSGTVAAEPGALPRHAVRRLPAAVAGRVEDVELPDPEPPEPQALEDLVPGVEDADPDGVPGEGFAAILHGPKMPWTVQWRCPHVHPHWRLAEACALAHRRGPAPDGPEEPPGLQAVPGGPEDWLSAREAGAQPEAAALPPGPPRGVGMNFTPAPAGQVPQAPGIAALPGVSDPEDALGQAAAATVILSAGSVLRVIVPAGARIASVVRGAQQEIMVSAPEQRGVWK